DPLDAVVDPEKALAPGAPIIHDEFGTNLVTFAQVPNPAVDEAMRKADKIIKFRIVNQRLAPVPMEARGVVAKWEAGYPPLRSGRRLRQNNQPAAGRGPDPR